MKVFLLAVPLLLCFTLAADSQQDFEVSVTTIHVWVTVEASSQILTQNDFEIFEDGKKMTPTCFERAPLGPDLEAPQPDNNASPETLPAANRSLKRIVLMVDQINTSQNEYLFLRKKIDEFLAQMEGKTEIMLAVVPPYEKLTPFTRDFMEIKNQLDRLTGIRDRDQRVAERRRDIRDALESMRKDRIAMAYNIALEGKLEEEQNTMLVFDALKSFHTELSKEQQNEHTVVVLISGGLNSHPGQQYLDMVEREAGADEEMRMMNRARSDFGKIMQQALGVLNRDNVTVYTINTRGQIDVVDNITESNQKYMVKGSDKADYMQDYQELLDHVAEETGGLSFRNSLNFKHGFDLILKDLDHQYLLCYVAPEHKNEGDYHKIKVVAKVKGLKIRNRAGYVD